MSVSECVLPQKLIAYLNSFTGAFVVRDPVTAEALWARGKFGKGTHSRSHASITTNPGEHVELMPCEALFLCTMDKVLCVVKENGEKQGEYVGIEELWTTCVTRDPRFPYLFAAYKHLRLRGWVVRSGLKYGVDFLLYNGAGPEFSHAEYGARVVFSSCQPGAEPLYSWEDIQAISRNMCNVVKGFFLCFATPLVFFQVDLCELNVCKGENEFGIDTILFQRWMPEQARIK